MIYASQNLKFRAITEAGQEGFNDYIDFTQIAQGKTRAGEFITRFYFAYL